MVDLEDRFLDFLRRRIDEMGLTASGAYDYYAQRLDKGEAFMPYERAVMRDVIALRPSRVVHAGIGIGPVTAALARAGIPAVGYEKDKARFAAAEALRDELGLEYDLRQSYYPDDDIGAGGLLLFTNVGAGWTREQEDAVIGTFACFDTVILDLRLFGSVRDTEADQDALRQRLSMVGRVENLPPIGGAAYVRIRPSPEARKRAASGVQGSMARSSTPKPADKSPIDALDAELVALHRQRLKSLGSDRSGLFEHYEQLLGQGSLISQGDRRRVDYILNSLPRYDRYVVYRAGLGELAFALAVHGRKVTAWEPNDLRRKAIEAGLDHLARRRPEIAGNLTLAGPDLASVDLPPGETSLGVAPVLLGVGGESDPSAILGQIGRTTAFLYSPRLFLTVRESEAAQAETRGLLQRAGFQTFEPAIGGLHLAGRPAGEPPRQSRLSFLPA